MISRKILSIEDDPRAASIQKKFLEHAGHQFFWAETCTDGIKMNRNKKPHLILLDQQVGPEETGLAIAETLKNDNPTAKIILMSNYNQNILQLDPDMKFIDETRVKSKTGLQDYLEMVK